MPSWRVGRPSAPCPFRFQHGRAPSIRASPSGAARPWPMRRCELQVLRLPVLGHRLGEMGRAYIAPETDRRFVVFELLLVVEAVARDRLADQGGRGRSRGRTVRASSRRRTSERHVRPWIPFWPSVVGETDDDEIGEPSADDHRPDPKHQSHGSSFGLGPHTQYPPTPWDKLRPAPVSSRTGSTRAPTYFNGPAAS